MIINLEKEMMKWIESVESIETEITSQDEENLKEALYAINQMRLWPDYVDSVSYEQLVFILKFLLKVGTDGFPEELKF